MNKGDVFWRSVFPEVVFIVAAENAPYKKNRAVVAFVDLFLLSILFLY